MNQNVNTLLKSLLAQQVNQRDSIYATQTQNINVTAKILAIIGADEISAELVSKALQQSYKEFQLVENYELNYGGEKDMPRPLKYGQGSIVERKRINKKSGTVYEWCEARWIDEYGIRHTKVCKNKTEARKLLDTNKRTLKTKKHKPKSFGVAFQEWYDVFRKPNISEKQHQEYQRCINRLPDNISKSIVQYVTMQDLQVCLNDIKSDKARYWTKILLIAFYERLVLDGIVKINIAKGLIADPAIAAERQTLSVEDEPKFFALIPEQYHVHAKCYLYIGCRLSELFRIVPEDVDHEYKTINIKETKTLTRAERKVKSYKIRIAPLLPEIENIQFPLPKISTNRLQISFQKACEKLGIKITPHDLRHTFASRCAEYGIDIKAILGHKHERMTNHYIHINAQKQREFVSKEFEKVHQLVHQSSTDSGLLDKD